MGFGQVIKNIVGDFLRYERCPVTGNTYWGEEKFIVIYARGIRTERTVQINRSAIEQYSREKIAEILINGVNQDRKVSDDVQKVFDDVQRKLKEEGLDGSALDDLPLTRNLTLAEIVAQIPESCSHFPR